MADIQHFEKVTTFLFATSPRQHETISKTKQKLKYPSLNPSAFPQI